jgi:UDP-N-acetylglucosamine diphosphorylase / glucose-1-phosphate thymidylyltransferase / UDP-N-acetylgalactosamine diphosphorylase / glucosamine-1-phosphate N-acetyltransferase / galactosamine-1-phosphate N-acetyltransferase
MKKIVFTEEFCQPENLFPFTLTRQIQDIRVGIFTIREKWEQFLQLDSYDKFEDDYKDLQRSIIVEESLGNDTAYLVHGNVLPSKALIRKVAKLKPGEFIDLPGKEAVVYCISAKEVADKNKIRVGKAVEFPENLNEIVYPWHILEHNSWAIRQDLAWIRDQRKPAKPSATNHITGNDLFIEKGATVEHCYINTTDGPVYIGKNALVMEGTMIRGPVAIGEGTVVKMGTKIYGATSIGPNCSVGGEIKNSVIFGSSNKAHDGYLGDSVLGEWCNLGAGTSNSNVKNNASSVTVYTPHGPVNLGLKCGMFMGDYSRTAINTSVNTGSVIGVSANIFGTGLTPKYVPSFSWGSDGLERYRFDKAISDIQSWKSLKGASITESEIKILTHIFEHY